MYATEKQNRGSDCSLIVVSLTTENNGIIHIRKAVAFSDFTFLLQTFCDLLYNSTLHQLSKLNDFLCLSRMHLERSDMTVNHSSVYRLPLVLNSISVVWVWKASHTCLPLVFP